MQVVKVVSYNPEWKKWFIELKAEIWPLVAGIALKIVHIGSTTIVGMSAKPIFDIDIVIESRYDLPEIITQLSKKGY